MPTGTVKYVRNGQGYGFISRDDKEPKVFVHVRQVMDLGVHELKKGQRFSFDLDVDSSGRTIAKNLKVL